MLVCIQLRKLMGWIWWWRGWLSSGSSFACLDNVGRPCSGSWRPNMMGRGSRAWRATAEVSWPTVALDDNAAENQQPNVKDSLLPTAPVSVISHDNYKILSSVRTIRPVRSRRPPYVFFLILLWQITVFAVDVFRRQLASLAESVSWFVDVATVISHRYGKRLIVLPINYRCARLLQRSLTGQHTRHPNRTRRAPVRRQSLSGSRYTADQRRRQVVDEHVRSMRRAHFSGPDSVLHWDKKMSQITGSCGWLVRRRCFTVDPVPGEPRSQSWRVSVPPWWRLGTNRQRISLSWTSHTNPRQ